MIPRPHRVAGSITDFRMDASQKGNLTASWQVDEGRREDARYSAAYSWTLLQLARGELSEKRGSEKERDDKTRQKALTSNRPNKVPGIISPTALSVEDYG